MTAVVERNSLHTLDQTGDTEIGWDPNNAAEVAAARATWDTLKGKGYMGYKIDGDERTQLHGFDPDARRIVMQRAMAGG